MKKILVFRFHQESNTFNPVVTDRAQFAQPTFSEVMTTRNAVSGGVDAIREAGGEAIPTIFLHAGSGGRVSDETFGFLLTQLEQAIRENTYTVQPVQKTVMMPAAFFWKSCAPLRGTNPLPHPLTCMPISRKNCWKMPTLFAVIRRIPIGISMKPATGQQSF